MANEDRETRKREQEAKRIKAIQSKLRADRPWIRGNELEFITDLIADGIMSHEDVMAKVDKDLVMWWKNGNGVVAPPDKEGKYAYPINEAMLKKGLKAFNSWMSLINLDNPKVYDLKDVNHADVKKFTQFELTGIHYLFVQTKDGKKFRLILEPTTKKVGENIKARENQGWTSAQKVAI